MQQVTIPQTACGDQPSRPTGRRAIPLGRQTFRSKALSHHPYKAPQTTVVQMQHPASGIPSAALALLSVVLAILAGPSVALASWPVESEPEVVTAFEETYVSESGVSRIHHGIDCAAAAGESVTSPVEGTVSFSGSVPAGEEEGCGTTLAVSIALEDGLTLTLMPFDEVLVEVGDQVGEGGVVGYLAPSGDKSSARTHLHVGLKRGRTYYDPSPLLGVASPTGEAQPQAEPDAVLVPVSDGGGLPIMEVATSQAQGSSTADADGAWSEDSGWSEVPSGPLVSDQPAEVQTPISVPVGGGLEEDASPQASLGASGPTIASDVDACERWLSERDAAESAANGQPGLFEQAGEFFSALPSRIASLAEDIASALGDAALVVATALLIALCAGMAVLVRTLLSRRKAPGRCKDVERKGYAHVRAAAPEARQGVFCWKGVLADAGNRNGRPLPIRVPTPDADTSHQVT